jgi:hypothetical protein
VKEQEPVEEGLDQDHVAAPEAELTPLAERPAKSGLQRSEDARGDPHVFRRGAGTADRPAMPRGEPDPPLARPDLTATGGAGEETGAVAETGQRLGEHQEPQQTIGRLGGDHVDRSGRKLK